MAQKKILIVDDEVMLVDMIRMRLEDSGYLVDSANDGLEALSKIALMSPDLIVLDIYMAKMDGYTMLKELRKNKKTKNTPVIVLTASGKHREIFDKEGISDYMVKPFDTEDFLARIDKVLGKRKKSK